MKPATCQLTGILLVFLTINAPATVRYVNLNNASPTPPYTDWSAAATNIQDAIDAAVDGDQILVTNGVYQTGGRVVYGSLTNRVVIDKAITVQSLNGPAATVIQGNGVLGDSAVRCVYLTNNAALIGFTLINGATRITGAADTITERSGGGAWCEPTNCILLNCVVVSNSAAQRGGGAYSAVLNNCILGTNSAIFGGGAFGGALSNCTVVANRANFGGGADVSILNDCTVAWNTYSTGGSTRGAGIFFCSATGCVISNNILGSSGNGAGADNSTLTNCLVINNSNLGTEASSGGGVSFSTLYNCTLSGNLAAAGMGGGGGAAGSTLYNCIIVSNRTFGLGGGTFGGTVNNCKFVGNRSEYRGGGAYYSVLNNCVLLDNSARTSAGGALGTLNNCIVYNNTAPSGSNYDDASQLNYCCTLPLPAGPGNITNEPALTDGIHISFDSPCRGAGSSTYTIGADIDGEAWLNPPSIGCDEHYAGAITGALKVTILAVYTNTPTGFETSFTGTIAGHAGISFWNFGDGTFVTNRVLTSHVWAASGDYPVILTAANESFPDGISATVTVHVATQIIHYVNVSGTNPLAPYISWATAATNIQDAVDAAAPAPASLVLVTNGIYRTGGRVVNSSILTNRLVVNKPIAVRSVNGFAATVIEGYRVNLAEVRCVYLATNALLAGFTLTNGGASSVAFSDNRTDLSGGGVWCESTNAFVVDSLVVSNSAWGYGGGLFSGTASNCIIILNINKGALGGGASGGILNNCLLATNSANSGGGANSNTLNRCTLIGNSMGAVNSTLNNCLLVANTTGANDSSLNNCTLTGNGNGAAAIFCALRNCILYSNTLNYIGGTFSNCCTTPAPFFGQGNFTNAPLFVNPATGDFHLQTNSPCINAGNNVYVTAGTDLDGNPRSAGGTMDVGAYEFQSPSSILSYAWAQQYGLPTDGSADFTDVDADGLNNWQEWIAGTVPTDVSSVLKMFSPSNNLPGVSVSWQSVSGKNYFLQRATDLTAQPPFSPVQSNLLGQAGSTIYTDTTATNGGPYFYRVGVQ